MKQEVITTKDGSKTIFIPEMDEQYHSVNGAITEAQHVFIEAGFNHHPSENPVVFEVGFGTGLNALLTALNAEEQKRNTLYVSIEKYPVAKELLQEINFGKQISKEAEQVFEKLHLARWEEETKISDYFRLLKLSVDLKKYSFTGLTNIDVVYFDAFAPDKQPAMWDRAIFEQIFKASSENSIITTYCAKGSIRRQLRDCGYLMERLPGPPGKRQMLRGTKNSQLSKSKKE